MPEGTRLESVNAVYEFDGRKQGATIPGQRENTRFRGDMERSVGEHSAESSQPCLGGAIRSKITALEEAYVEYMTIYRRGLE